MVTRHQDSAEGLFFPGNLAQTSLATLKNPPVFDRDGLSYALANQVRAWLTGDRFLGVGSVAVPYDLIPAFVWSIGCLVDNTINHSSAVLVGAEYS